ncbi:hypothetical protein YC2023_055802 [Brassica napus]
MKLIVRVRVKVTPPERLADTGDDVTPERRVEMTRISLKECKRVVSKRVPMNHGRRGKNGS